MWLAAIAFERALFHFQIGSRLIAAHQEAQQRLVGTPGQTDCL